MQLDDVTTTNDPGLNDAGGPSAVAEHGCEAAASQRLFHAGAWMTAAREQEPGLADFQDSAAGDFKIETMNRQVSPRLAELDRATQQGFEDGKVLVLKQGDRANARPTMVRVGAEIPSFDLHGGRKTAGPDLDDFHVSTRHRFLGADTCQAREALTTLRHILQPDPSGRSLRARAPHPGLAKTSGARP
jgi:hypothetical protein